MVHDIYRYRFCKFRPCADPLCKSNFDYIFTNITNHIISYLLVAKMQSKLDWKELVMWWGSDGLC